MKGWVVPELGRAEWRDDLAEPVAGEGEVVLEVVAAAPNFADRLMIDGQYQERPELPFTPGIEVVGPVVGSDRVVVGLTTHTGRGAWAERAVCRAGSLCDVPDGVDPTDALAVHVNAQTAWFALHRRGAIQPGEVVLVHAAAGGVGSMAVQLARVHGCRVIATSSSAKRDFCLGLGAEAWFDNRDPDWREAVRAACGTVDVVIDAVGGSVFTDSMRLLGFEGRIVMVGFVSGEHPKVAVNHVLVKNVAVTGLYWGRYVDERPDLVGAAADEIFGHLAAGRIDPLITNRGPITDALAAVDAVAAGRTTGKTILTP